MVRTSCWAGNRLGTLLPSRGPGVILAGAENKHMNEAEWLACNDPQPMLEGLYRRVSNRKLRLFACACCWRIGHLFDEIGRRAVATAELIAEGRASKAEEEAALEAVGTEWRKKQRMPQKSPSLAVARAIEGDAEGTARNAAGALAWAYAGENRIIQGVDTAIHIRDSERLVQAGLLRDIVGHIFSRLYEAPTCTACCGEGTIAEVWKGKFEKRGSLEAFIPDDPELPEGASALLGPNSPPTLYLQCQACGGKGYKANYLADPCWLSWHDATVPRIAEAIYDDRRFSDLAILADALMDAGCHDESILAHCRSPGPHVRGCWVVDLLLGKQ
jgi:hypothetical protein